MSLHTQYLLHLIALFHLLCLGGQLLPAEREHLRHLLALEVRELLEHHLLVHYAEEAEAALRCLGQRLTTQQAQVNSTHKHKCTYVNAREEKRRVGNECVSTC